MKRVCILVLIGLPASGKSSFAAELCEIPTQFDSRSQTQPQAPPVKCKAPRPTSPDNMLSGASKLMTTKSDILEETFSRHLFHQISFDDLMPNESSIFEPNDDNLTSNAPLVESKWKLHRKKIMKCIEKHMITNYSELLDASNVCEGDEPQGEDPTIDPALWELFQSCVPPSTCSRSSAYITYIIDDNMYYQSMRYEYFQLARKYQVGFAQLFFKTSLENVLRKNRKREARVPDDIITKMATNIEPPAKESQWESNSLSASVEEFFTKKKEVLDLIVQAILNPVKPNQGPDEEERNASRRVCSKNIIHKSDKFLRKLVSTSISEAKESGSSKDEMKQLAAKLNGKRNKILADMRVGSLLIDENFDNPDVNDVKLFAFLNSIFNDT